MISLIVAGVAIRTWKRYKLRKRLVIIKQQMHENWKNKRESLYHRDKRARGLKRKPQRKSIYNKMRKCKWKANSQI